MPEIVNIVGSGNINQRLDLLSLYTDIEPPLAEYDPEMYHGMYLFSNDEESPSITMYTSGKYIIVGAESVEELEETRQEMLQTLSRSNEINDIENAQIEINNIVASGDVGMELDLDQVSIELGLEDTEYDPRNFPGVIYDDSKNNCTMLIFRTGKVTITGATSFVDIENAYEQFLELLPQ
jgi:transcription initiation factor TFIID TATA-box-binding protein